MKLPNIIEFVLSSDTVDDRPVPRIFFVRRLLCFDHGTDLSQTASLLNTNLNQEEKGAESEEPEYGLAVARVRISTEKVGVGKTKPEKER